MLNYITKVDYVFFLRSELLYYLRFGTNPRRIRCETLDNCYIMSLYLERERAIEELRAWDIKL